METLAVIIGRFQPLHKAHINMIKYAQENYDNVLILVGTRTQRSLKNPFTFDEVAEMIYQNFNDIIVTPLYDKERDEDWIEEIRELTQFDGDVTLVGCDKDDSTYYLNMLSENLGIKLDLIKEQGENFNATAIREIFRKYGATAKLCNDYLGYTNNKLLQRANHINRIAKNINSFAIAFDYHGVLTNPKVKSLFLKLKKQGYNVCILTGQYTDKIKEEFKIDKNEEFLDCNIISVLDYCKFLGVELTKDENGNDWIFDLDFWHCLKNVLCIKNDIKILIDDTNDYLSFINTNFIKFINVRDLNKNLLHETIFDLLDSN